MRTQILKSLLLLAGLAVLIIPASAALAEDKTDTDKKVKHVIIGDREDNLIINSDGSELTISFSEDGKSRVTIVDMEQVGHMVGESLSAAAEAIAEMQLEIRMGNDNSFTFAMEDEEWEVDVNAIVSEVSAAFSGAFEDMDEADWAHHRHYRTHHDEDLDEMQEELQDELNDLQDELKNLKKELARLKKLKEEG